MTSAISRRWQRHHKDSLHMTATRCSSRAATSTVSAWAAARNSLGTGVCRVGAKSLDLPPRVQALVISWHPPPPTEPRLPAVPHPCSGQPLLDLFLRDMRVATTAGETANVHDQSHSGTAQQLGELGLRRFSVPECEQGRHRWPSLAVRGVPHLLARPCAASRGARMAEDLRSCVVQRDRSGGACGHLTARR
jgi:hypothetical protein